MNDYPDLSHPAIDAMMRAGDPAQAAEWAERARLLGRNLSAAAGELRTVIAMVPATWSDGTGSSRMVAELTVVADRLDLLADLLAGQPASCAGLIGEAASALALAQESSDAAPAAGNGPAEYSVAGRRDLRAAADIALGRRDGRIVLLDAARLAAGERATLLDERYRTVLARLTPPPQPPRQVPDARGDVAPADQPRPMADATPGTATNLGSAMNPGSATNPGIGAGAMVGGADDWRHTWLVEDRDLYATGPSVRPVIGGG
jgi:hypothetical protein